MFYLLIKISPLPKYSALYLKIRIHQILFPFDILFLALKGLVYKILSLYIHWRPYNGRSYFRFFALFSPLTFTKVHSRLKINSHKLRIETEGYGKKERKTKVFLSLFWALE